MVRSLNLSQYASVPARRQVPALFAMADGQAAQRRPGVGEHAVHVVERVDLPHDGRHVIGHVGGEHAGAEQPRVLGVMHDVALRVALEPLRMRLDGVFPIEVGTHARDHVQPALLGGGAAVAEEIAVAEVLAFPVERHLGLVERQDAGDAHHHGIHLQAGPVVRPLLDVEHDRVVFGHVDLAERGGSCAARGRRHPRRIKRRPSWPRGTTMNSRRLSSMGDL